MQYGDVVAYSPPRPARPRRRRVEGVFRCTWVSLHALAYGVTTTYYLTSHITVHTLLGPTRRRSVRPLLVSAPVLSQPPLARAQLRVALALPPGQRASQSFSCQGFGGRRGAAQYHRSAAHVSRSSSNRHEEAPDDQPTAQWTTNGRPNHYVRTYVRAEETRRFFFIPHLRW